MAMKTQLMQPLRESYSINPMNLSMVEFDASENLEIPSDLPGLPLTTMEDVDAFENLLFNDVHFKQVAVYLGALGGSDVCDTTRRVLCKLMTNRLAMSFNWAGRPPKRAFKTLRSRDLVINAVRRNPMLMQPVLESDIEETVKKWLRYAAGRQH